MQQHEMSERQALALAGLALDYLLDENGETANKNHWANELSIARRVIRGMTHRPRGEFFISPASPAKGRKPKGRERVIR